MRELFSIDTKDYDLSAGSKVRPSVRAIIVREGKVAMIHSTLYDYYKFPGGGIEANESHEDALVREVAEESGLAVRRESIKAYGHVFRIQRYDDDDPRAFVQDNFYYLCEADDGGEMNLDEYESKEGFTLEFVTPDAAIEKNLSAAAPSVVMRTREARVLKMMLDEGIVLTKA